ncbi:tail fiber protein [Vibrio phage 1.204.O._10N.222.46.F12]|uniref:Tail fiber protein n=1 Tax=Vibrio phage 1.204.O._10N.222.46.F12 TaxID=1881263 RepID=A0A2I7RNL2_9CAUD|nr:tail fiber protein [Vibrio phage 1.204.O._10N.222.46.F12]AUR95229.1 tail fiber protein [Vibrio phage 1.204.O._10N.222.46.F12]
MALSAQTYQGDGSNTDFVLDFTLGYISESHIHVYVDDVEIPQNTLQFILGGGSVRLPTAPTLGSEVLVRRIVPNDKLLHDYENGSLVIESNLDESNLQSIMLQHEAVDGFSTGIYGDINFFTEISDSPEDTAESPRGVEQVTITGLASLAEDQRDEFETTFNAQFVYKRIGNLSDYSGMTLTEEDKLNSYQYPDDSGNWYAPLQGQAFPYVLPIDPTVSDSGMVLTSTVGIYRGIWPDTGGIANKGDTYQTQVSNIPTGKYFTALQDTITAPVGDDVNWREVVSVASISNYTNLAYSSVADMISGNPIIANVNDKCTTPGTSWTRISSNNGDIRDFRYEEKISAADFGNITRGKGSIADSIIVSGQIISAITNYTSVAGPAIFTIPSDVYFDAQTLFAAIPAGSGIVASTQEDGTSYAGYTGKASWSAYGDTQDNDSRHVIESGHNALLNLFNAQLPNTGVGGVGQSSSSLDGRCSITAQAGYEEVNGRQVRAKTSRLQRYQTGGVGPIHWGLQHPTETGVGTRTLFDFDSNGNASFGGYATKDEYNLLVYPQNTNAPALDKRTTIAMRNVQSSGNGCRVEMVARNAANTNSFAINYDGNDLILGDYESLEGGYAGNIDRYILGRTVAPGDQSRVVIYDDDNRGSIFARNTLSSGLTRTMLLLQAASNTAANYNWCSFFDTFNSISRFSVDGLGNVTANSYTPFTGCHLFFSSRDIEVGTPVDLVDGNQVDYITYPDPYGEESSTVQLNGTISPSGALSKLCVGLVHSSREMEGGFMIMVAAAGDNRSGELKGFKVNDEGGKVQAGDILCTSSTVGELMKIPDNSEESVVRFKSLSTPDNSNVVYGYF